MSGSRLKLSAQKRKVGGSFSILDAADDFEDEGTVFRLPVLKRAKQDRNSSRPSKARGRPRKNKVPVYGQSKDKGKHKTKICTDEVTLSEACDTECSTHKESDDDIEILSQFEAAKEHDIDLQEDLKELEQSLSSPSEKLCLCCKLVVPTDIFTSHFKDCIQKFKRGTKLAAGHPSSETPGRSNEDQVEDIFQCPICLEVNDEKVSKEHIDTCSAEHGITQEQALQVVSLYKKQTLERKSLGLPTHLAKLQKEATVPPVQSCKPKSKYKKGGTNDPEFQMAIALSSSLAQEEDHKRFVMEEQLVDMGLSNIVEEDRKTQLLLPYNKIEKGKGTTGRKGAQATRKGKVLALYSPRKRQHIISEKVATILSVTEECTWNASGESKKRQKLKSKALSRFHDEHSSLWDVSNQTAEEELESYFVPDLQDFIKPKQLVVGRLFKRLSQIPGRLNTTKMTVSSDSESEDQDMEEVGKANLDLSENGTHCTQLALAELLSSQNKFEMTIAEKLDTFQITEGEALDDQNYESMEAASGFWIEHDNVQKELEKTDTFCKPESSKCEGSLFGGTDRECSEMLNTSYIDTKEAGIKHSESMSPGKEKDDIEMIDISDSPVQNNDEGNVPHTTTLSQESQTSNEKNEMKKSQSSDETQDIPLSKDVENFEGQHDVLLGKDLLCDKENYTDSLLKGHVSKENKTCLLAKEIPKQKLHEWKGYKIDKKENEKGSDKNDECAEAKCSEEGVEIDYNTHKNYPEKGNTLNDFDGLNSVLGEKGVFMNGYCGNHLSQLSSKDRKTTDKKDSSVYDVEVECEKVSTKCCKVMRTEACSSVSQKIISEKIPDPDLPNKKSLNIKFVQSWANLLASGKCSDVRIKTQSIEIPAHFLVLLVRCSVLYEEAHKSQGFVNWEDCSYEGALEFLSFLYTGQCSLSSKEDLHWVDVFDLALKYKCQDLVEYLQKLYIDSPKKELSHTSPASPENEDDCKSSELCSPKLKEGKRSIDGSQSSLETVVFDASNPSLDKRKSLSRTCFSISNTDCNGTRSPDLFNENVLADDNVSFISTPQKSPVGSDVSFISTPRKSPLTFPLIASPKSNLSPKCLFERNICSSLTKSPIRRFQKRTKGCYDMNAISKPLFQENWENYAAHTNSNKDQYVTEKYVSECTIGKEIREDEDSVTHTKVTKKVDHKAVMPDTNCDTPEPSLSGLIGKENEKKDAEGLCKTSEELKTPEKMDGVCELLSVVKKKRIAEKGLKCGLHTPEKQDSKGGMEGKYLHIIKSPGDSFITKPHSPGLVDKEMSMNTPEERIVSPQVSESNENMNQSYINKVWDDFDNVGYDADIVCSPISEKTFVNNENKFEKESDDEIHELEAASDLNAQVSPKASESVCEKFQKSKIEQYEAESPSHFRSKKFRTSESPRSENICSDDSPDSDSNGNINCDLKVCGPPCSNDTLVQITKELNDYEGWISKMDMTWDEGNKEIVSSSSKIKDVETVLPISKTRNVEQESIKKINHNFVEEKNEAPDTPQVKKKKKVDVTPLPNYKEMLSPELKKQLSKYGIRPISKRKAVLLLNHIYEKTHPLVTDSEPDTSYIETPGKATDKTVNNGQSKKNWKKVTAGSKIKKGSNNSKKSKAKTQAKEKVHCPSPSSENELNSSQASSNSSEGSEFECAEETMLAGCNEQDSNSPTQKDIYHSVWEAILFQISSVTVLLNPFHTVTPT
ncbi:mutagen-sensitive 312 isoform X2 [Oratosquilla oratoria]|uniref:mutagen-sensitive 312 isoform X2 n=1 Tax=Oratosquilla oratoria TaxID=337810 RepID=UPI003F76561C